MHLQGEGQQFGKDKGGSVGKLDNVGFVSFAYQDAGFIGSAFYRNPGLTSVHGVFQRTVGGDAEVDIILVGNGNGSSGRILHHFAVNGPVQHTVDFLHGNYFSAGEGGSGAVGEGDGHVPVGGIGLDSSHGEFLLQVGNGGLDTAHRGLKALEFGNAAFEAGNLIAKFGVVVFLGTAGKGQCQRKGECSKKESDGFHGEQI